MTPIVIGASAGVELAADTVDEVAAAVAELLAWPLVTVQIRGLFPDAWRLRHTITIADELYVTLAEHLGADLLTDDQRLNTLAPQGSPSRPLRCPDPPGIFGATRPT